MPPNESNLNELSGMPQLPNLRLGSGKFGPFEWSSASADAYNQLLMAEYNNKYNYWLWQQQAEYNSPSNQVKRLKEAGLNPNFNSIEGAGNLGSMPTSSGSITPSIGRNRAAQVGNVISSVNALIGGVSEGIKSLGNLSDVPPLSKLGEYRNTLYKTARSVMRQNEYKEFRALVGSVIDSIAAGGNFPEQFELWSPFTTQSFYKDGTPAQTGNIVIAPEEGSAISSMVYKALNAKEDNAIKQLVKAAKSYYNENIQPKEAEIAEGKSGMQSIGKALSKITSGESLSWREIIAIIGAGLVSKFL